MQIIPDKEEERERVVISPGKAGVLPPLDQDVVMALTRWDLKELLSIAGAGRIWGGGALYGLYRSSGGAAGGSFTIGGPFLGAPHAVIGLEQIIARGGRRIWVLGWCGSLQKDLEIGEFLVPEGAISEEGTSPHYLTDGRVPGPDSEMMERLCIESARLGRKTRKGLVWTTDAIYRETFEKVISYQRRGVMAVEMEISALFTVAAYRGVRTAALLVVSDELGTLQWKHGFKSDALKEATRDACRVMKGLASAGGSQVFCSGPAGQE